MDNQETAREYFLAALKALENNALPDAESLLRQALGLAPERVSVLTNLSVVLIRLARYDEALTYAKKSVHLDPNNVEGWLNLAKCHAMHGDNRSSIACLEKAHHLEPHSTRILYELSSRCQHENDIKQAHLYLTKGRVIEFGDADAFSDYGVALANAGNPIEALVNFDQAIALKPDDADIHNNRGNSLRELKRFEAAAASYDAAIALKPDFAEAYCNRGNVLGDLKRYQAAVDAYDKAIALAPDLAEAYNNRGNALQELKRYEAAVASYDRAIALKPGFAGACNGRGNSLRELKRFEAAAASYSKAIELKPEFSAASENLGHTYLLLGKHAEGLQLIAKHSGFIRFTSASGVRLVLEADHEKN